MTKQSPPNIEGEDTLREQISNFMSDLMVEVSLEKLDMPLKPDSGLRFIKAHNEKLDKIMQLIKSHQATIEREARKKFLESCKTLECFIKEYM